MGVIGAVIVAAGLGVLWVAVARAATARRRLLDGPAPVRAALGAYRKGRWSTVIDIAPAVLSDSTGPGEDVWRPALELALGHSLVQMDRPSEAIAHLERGLLLEAARRRASGAPTPSPSEHRFRHLLAWSYGADGRSSAARREYRRLLEADDLEPSIRAAARRALADRGEPGGPQDRPA